MRGLGISKPMFFIGIVENNEDKQFQGRVQVRAFGVHGTHADIPTKDLPWAICVSGHYDPNSPIPPMNSFVFGMFIDGDEAQHPMILGMIPTQYVDEMIPGEDGYGVIPIKNGELLAKGFTPEDIGEHQSAKVRRAEEIGTTYHKQVSANAVQNQIISNLTTEDKDGNEVPLTWAQPPSAYSAQYPFNRVIETAKHTIELDDTPGGERIMIHHKSGAFIQIDSGGTVTERAEGDRYEVSKGTRHESSEGSVVTINGNAHVYIKGDKTEVVEGNYKLHVKGTMELGAGGNLFLNTSDQLAARGSTVKVESLTDAVTIFGKSQIKMEAEKQINILSANIKQNALLDYAVYSTKGFKFSTPLDFHLTSSNIIMTATGLVPPGSAPVLTGTLGSPTSAGINFIAPTLNIAAGNTSVIGMLNATVLNGAIITGTTGNFSNLFALNAEITKATTALCEAVSLKAVAYKGPVGSSPAVVKPPVISIPTIPALNPVAVSDPTPPLFGKASGWAYPVGNGPEFLSKVLTSPFSVLGGIIPALDTAGYGMPLVKMPEPPKKSTIIECTKPYSPRGYSVGIFNTSLED